MTSDEVRATRLLECVEVVSVELVVPSLIGALIALVLWNLVLLPLGHKVYDAWRRR